MAGDVVAFDSNSGNANITVDVASACASLVMSGTYAGTLTYTSTLTLTSTYTSVPACTIAGTTGTLILAGTATITSGGKTLTCGLSCLTSNTTFTLADNWTVTGLVTAGFNGNTVTFNGVGKTLTCNGGWHQVAGGATIAGTAKVVMGGGTWDNAGTGTLGTDVDLAGTVTVSGAVAWGATGKTLAYVSGTITTTGSTLTVSTAGTLTTSGVTWNNVTFTGAVTYTFSAGFAWSGTMTISGAAIFAGAALSSTGAVTVTTAGTVTLNNTGGLVTTGTLTLPNAALTWAGSAGYTVGTQTTATLTASRTHTYTFGNTYTVTTALGNVGATATVRQAMVSSSAGNKVVFTVTAGAALTLSYCDPTDINSSGGGLVTSVGGTITTSLNWTGSVVAGGGFPVASDVRNGVSYGNGTLTGTLVCASGRTTDGKST